MMSGIITEKIGTRVQFDNGSVTDWKSPLIVSASSLSDRLLWVMSWRQETTGVAYIENTEHVYSPCRNKYTTKNKQ